MSDRKDVDEREQDQENERPDWNAQAEAARAAQVDTDREWSTRYERMSTAELEEADRESGGNNMDIKTELAERKFYNKADPTAAIPPEPEAPEEPAPAGDYDSAIVEWDARREDAVFHLIREQMWNDAMVRFEGDPEGFDSYSKDPARLVAEYDRRLAARQRRSPSGESGKPGIDLSRFDDATRDMILQSREAKRKEAAAPSPAETASARYTKAIDAMKKAAKSGDKEAHERASIKAAELLMGGR